ncbi:MAG: hypothetical protein Q4C87_00405 [Actinomycetaceae bacterium]|nr:hypothetical protein [Actinomycetaceae bacterium]
METRGEIIAAINKAIGMPNEQPVFDLLSQAAVAADELGEENLSVWARLMLSRSYLYTPHRMKAFPPFAWCLEKFRTNPEIFDNDDRQTLLWDFKHIVVTAAGTPDVPLEQVRELQDEFNRLYREQGGFAHTVHAVAISVASALWDDEAEDEHMVGWRATPRDEYSNCEGCDPELEVNWLIRRERYEEAIAASQRVLSGDVGCAEQPASTYASLTVAFEYLGRKEEAWQAHTRAYRHQRDDDDNLDEMTRHLHYLVISGNLERGLKLLREQASWVEKYTAVNLVGDYLASAASLLQSLDERGRGGEEFGASMTSRMGIEPAFNISPRLTIAEAAQACEEAAMAIALRFDQRNGHSRDSDATRKVIARRPLEGASASTDHAEEGASPALVNEMTNRAGTAVAAPPANTAPATAAVPAASTIPTGPTAWEGISWPTTPDEVVLVDREAQRRRDDFLHEFAEDAAFYLADYDPSPEYAFEWACLLAEVYADLQEFDIAKEWLVAADNSTPPEGPLVFAAIRLLNTADRVEAEKGEGLSVTHRRFLQQESPGIIAEVQKLWQQVAHGQENEDFIPLLVHNTLTLAETLIWEEMRDSMEEVISVLEGAIQILSEKDSDDSRVSSAYMHAFLVVHSRHHGDFYAGVRSLSELLVGTEEIPVNVQAMVYDTRAAISRSLGQYEDAISDYEKYIDLHRPYESLLCYPFYLSVLGQHYCAAERYDDAIVTFLKALEPLRAQPRLGNLALMIRGHLLSAFNQEIADESWLYVSESGITHGNRHAEIVYKEALEQARAYALRGQEVQQCEALGTAALAARWMKNNDEAANLHRQAIRILHSAKKDYFLEIVEHSRQLILDLAVKECEGEKHPHHEEIHELYSQAISHLEEMPRRYQDEVVPIRIALDIAWMSAIYKVGDIAKSAAIAVAVAKRSRESGNYEREVEALLHLGFLRWRHPGGPADLYWDSTVIERLCDLVDRLEDAHIRGEYLHFCELTEASGHPPLPRPVPVPLGIRIPEED